MIELSVLGLHALRGSDGRELGALPAQPKRFALLAYLAIGAGEGYHRRDTLAAMFWPDMDQFAARRALRNTLYHLREALGDGVIVTRGDEAVAIDATKLTCDVTQLGAAVDSGRYEEAVDYYRGELLAGVHFVSAGEAFEEWLSNERRRIADLVMRAIRALVEREELAGNGVAAAYWAQRACALAPGDENWLRRAMALLDEGGDTGGALRLHEAHTRRLAADFDATPSAETETLAARIRDGSRKARAPREVIAPVAPQSMPTTAPFPATDHPVLRATPAGRLPRRMVWTAGFVAAAALAVLLARVAGANHPRTPVARARVLVTVFENRTGDSVLQSLGRMTQDWLAQGIVHTQLVDVVDPRAVFVQGRASGTAAADPVAMAHRTGAAMVVSGSYYRTGDTLFFQAAVTDVRTNSIVRVVGPILTSVHTPVAALDELRSRVMTALASAVDVHATQDLSAGGEIPPFDAYQSYVEGWDSFWHGEGRRAEALFLQSAHRDTAFAAALIAVAMVASNSGECPLVDSVTRALDARSQKLERVERLSLQIADARCHGRNDEMLRLALERADLEPGYSSAQVPAAAAALWANRPERALEVLKRVDPATDLAWSTDTTHFTYWFGITEALHMLGRHREELAAVDRVSAGAPLGRAWLRGSALAALSRPTAALAVIDSSLALPVETVGDLGLAPYTNGRPQYTVTPAWVANWIAWELATHGDTVAARQAESRALAWYRSRPAEERSTPEERLVASWSLELLGNIPEAMRLARQLVAEDSANIDFRGELATLAAERGDTALADTLDGWLAAQPVARASWTASLYRARLAALLGRMDAAMARARETSDEGAWPRWLHVDPALARLRSRPDFIALTSPRD